MKTLTVNRQSTSNTKSLLKFLDEVKVGETLEIICEESFFKFDRFIKDEDGDFILEEDNFIEGGTVTICKLGIITIIADEYWEYFLHNIQGALNCLFFETEFDVSRDVKCLTVCYPPTGDFVEVDVCVDEDVKINIYYHHEIIEGLDINWTGTFPLLKRIIIETLKKK